MLSVIYAQCHLCSVSFVLSVIYAECHNQAYYAECQYAEYCGTFKSVTHRQTDEAGLGIKFLLYVFCG